jgi:hypothetical protein
MKKISSDRIQVIEVFYNTKLRNWDAVSEKELKRLRLNSSEVRVICYPSTKLNTSATVPAPRQLALFST